MKEFIKNELSSWKKWEVTWLIVATAIIAALSVYWGDSLMGIVSAVTGVICVVCTGKGKLSAYTFGLVNCVLYAIIAYEARYWGEVALNLLYYCPMQFVGFYTWSRHMNSETHEVEKRRMNWLNRGVLVLAIGVSTFVFGLILQQMGDPMPYVDSFTTVSSVIAMIISVKMFAEQWIIWIAVDVFSIVLWMNNLIKELTIGQHYLCG